MSSYWREAKHPKTGVWEKAMFIDDYFGSHIYGVEFKDGSIYREEDVESRDSERDPLAPEASVVSPLPPLGVLKPEVKRELPPYEGEDREDEFCPVRLDRLKREAQNDYRMMAQSMKELERMRLLLEGMAVTIHANTKAYVKKLSEIEVELHKVRFNYVANQRQNGKEI